MNCRYTNRIIKKIIFEREFFRISATKNSACILSFFAFFFASLIISFEKSTKYIFPFFIFVRCLPLPVPKSKTFPVAFV